VGRDWHVKRPTIILLNDTKNGAYSPVPFEFRKMFVTLQGFITYFYIGLNINSVSWFL
jgi:hypothetical protein